MIELTQRIVNAKRHTLGYVADNKRQMSKAQAIKEARKGNVIGVRVANGPSGPYLTSDSSIIRLYSLPVKVVGKDSKFAKQPS